MLNLIRSAWRLFKTAIVRINLGSMDYSLFSTDLMHGNVVNNDQNLFSLHLMPIPRVPYGYQIVICCPYELGLYPSW